MNKKEVKRIYIMGTVGTGKTTLAKKLSEEYQINHFELDNLIWKQINNKEVRRTEEEVNTLFQDILDHETWIVEDVGRKQFESAQSCADIIIFLDIPRFKRDYRILKRWIKQRLHIEKSRYKPTFAMLRQMYKWSHHDDKKRIKMLNDLKQDHKNVIIVNKNDVEIIKVMIRNR